jgi:hypothetical protein
VFRRIELDETVIFEGPLETHIDLLWENMADELPQGLLEAGCRKMGLTQAPREEHPRTVRAAKRQKVEESLVDTFKRVLP